MMDAMNIGASGAYTNEPMGSELIRNRDAGKFSIHFVEYLTNCKKKCSNNTLLILNNCGVCVTPVTMHKLENTKIC